MPWSTDIAAADSMRCKLHDADYCFNRHFEVIDSCNELCSIAGIDQLPDAARLDLWPDRRKEYQVKRDLLIPVFVNHLNNGGNWTGQTSIPFWTKEDIFTYLDEPEIQPVLSDLPAWFNQQYKILNLLKWRKLFYNYDTVTNSKERSNGAWDPDFDTSWADTLAGLPAWKTGTTNGNPSSGSISLSQLYYGGYSTAISMLSREFRVTGLSFGGMQCSVDQYGYARMTTHYGKYVIYYSADGYLEEKFNLVQSDPEATVTEIKFPMIEFGPPLKPVQPVEPLEKYATGFFFEHAYGLSCAIAKFDGPNGKTYKAS